MHENQNHPGTDMLDLCVPANRFESASRMYGRLHRWWLLLRRYWWLLGLILAAVLVPACLYTSLSGPSYESKARLWLTGKINVSAEWSYTEELVNFLGTQAELLKSPAIQNRALAAMREDAGPEAGSNAHPSIPFEVKVLEGAKSSTLELRAVGPAPASTRKFLDCLMEAYLDFKRESLDQASREATKSLNAEAAQLKDELKTAQAQLQSFQGSNYFVFLEQQGGSAESYLASLNRQLATLQTELKLLNSLTPEQWAETDAARPGSAPSAGDETMARQLLSSLAESQSTLFQADQKMRLLMAERGELSRVLRPAHPKIIKLDQDIKTQEEIVKVSRDEAANQLTLRRQALESQIGNLEASTDDLGIKALESGRKMTEFGQIQQNVQRYQAAYDKVLGLIQNIDVNKRLEQGNVGILEPASVAKSTHRRIKIMTVASAIALLLCLGTVYCIGMLQDDFASRTELAGLLAEPVVGQIPSIVMDDPRARPGIKALESQHFEFLEAFRSIRASLLATNNGTPGPKSVVVTSSVPGEGKSTVALYLAATLARAGTRVLLIDADMRRPCLHKPFGLAPGPGLAELLNGEIASLDMRPTGVEQLSLLPAGKAKRNPGDLVLNPAWPQLLASVRQQFDFIIVDTPPVAATEDAAALAPKADGVLFVVRALSTSARVARSALDVLRQRRVRVLGLIFNGVVSSPYERQYHQTYAHAYHWQPDQAASGGRSGRRLPDPAKRLTVVNRCD